MHQCLYTNEFADNKPDSNQSKAITITFPIV